MREIPVFARAGFTNPFGKIAEHPLRNIRLPMVVKEALERQAAEIRVPLHEFVREVLTVKAMGAEVVKRTYEKRIDAIAEGVPEKSATE